MFRSQAERGSFPKRTTTRLLRMSRTLSKNPSRDLPELLQANASLYIRRSKKKSSPFRTSRSFDLLDQTVIFLTRSILKNDRQATSAQCIYVQPRLGACTQSNTQHHSRCARDAHSVSRMRIASWGTCWVRLGPLHIREVQTAVQASEKVRQKRLHRTLQHTVDTVTRLLVRHTFTSVAPPSFPNPTGLQITSKTTVPWRPVAWSHQVVAARNAQVPPSVPDAGFPAAAAS